MWNANEFLVFLAHMECHEMQGMPSIRFARLTIEPGSSASLPASGNALPSL